MIKSENRLRKNKQFKYIYNHGECKTFDYISLVFVQTKCKDIKVGFSVSKKIGKSVVRNKVKRRLRECFCALKKNMDQLHNYIFIARCGIEKLTYEELKTNMKNLLVKCGLYNENI